jgi:hypothetical protein
MSKTCRKFKAVSVGQPAALEVLFCDPSTSSKIRHFQEEKKQYSIMFSSYFAKMRPLTSFELANADLKKYLGGEKKVFSFWRF